MVLISSSVPDTAGLEKPSRLGGVQQKCRRASPVTLILFLEFSNLGDCWFVKVITQSVDDVGLDELDDLKEEILCKVEDWIWFHGSS